MKKIFFSFIILLLISSILLYVFRADIFTQSIYYREDGKKNTYKASAFLKENIERYFSYHKVKNIENLIDLSLNFTTEHLDYNSNKKESSPTKIFQNREAYINGYSALFNTVMNYMIKKKKWEKEYKSEHIYGEMFVGESELVEYVEKSFFELHDFNKIVDFENNKYIYIDPFIFDYFGVKYINIID